MSKVYLLTEDDFENLLSRIKEDPRHRNILHDRDERIYEEAYRHYNYHIHRWMSKVKED
jgi:hypothetical protein